MDRKDGKFRRCFVPQALIISGSPVIGGAESGWKVIGRRRIAGDKESLNMNKAMPHRLILEQIARRVMLERGLLPDFSAEVLAELDRIPSPATAEPGQVRDLRALLWASIDNDDSRDLDQLTVAEALPDGAVKILVAVADVDALVVKKARPSIDTPGTIRPRSTRRRRSSRCCPKSSPPTSLLSTAEEDRLAVVVEMVIGADGSLQGSDDLSGPGPQSGQAGLQQRRRLARGRRTSAGRDCRRSRA